MNWYLIIIILAALVALYFFVVKPMFDARKSAPIYEKKQRNSPIVETTSNPIFS